VKAAAKRATAALAAAVTAACTKVQPGNINLLENLIHNLCMEKDAPALPEFGSKLIQRLFDTGMLLNDVIWTIVPTSAAAAPI
jgi:hypothetical protein